MLYLDYNATTPVDPEVVAAMEPYLGKFFANPSSGHQPGRECRAAIDKARLQVANMLGATSDEIIFTSGGTEANNHAIIGAALARESRGRHIITSTVEHPAVLEVCRHLETRGFSFTQVPVDSYGMVSIDDVANAITDQTTLITIMLANNEVGTLQPLKPIARLARSHNILTHTDCAQAVGKVPVNLKDLGVDMISLAGHKLYGPKGIGALCLRQGVEIPNLMFGASQENGRRPGTENILEIVGLGVACRLVSEDLHSEMDRLKTMRDYLEKTLLGSIKNSRINGHPEHRLPNTSNISFKGQRSDTIMAAMPDVAVSAGAACHGGGPVASQVLTSMDIPSAWALGTLRISLGRMTKQEEVEQGCEKIIAAVEKATQS